MNNFSCSAAHVDERADVLDEMVDAPVEEAICANQSVGDTENKVDTEVKTCADKTADVGNKACADETTNVKSCVDETADVGNNA